MDENKKNAREEAANRSCDKKSYKAPTLKKMEKLAQVTGVQKVTGGGG